MEISSGGNIIDNMDSIIEHFKIYNVPAETISLIILDGKEIIGYVDREGVSYYREDALLKYAIKERDNGS